MAPSLTSPRCPPGLRHGLALCALLFVLAGPLLAACQLLAAGRDCSTPLCPDQAGVVHCTAFQADEGTASRVPASLDGPGAQLAAPSLPPLPAFAFLPSPGRPGIGVVQARSLVAQRTQLQI